MRNQIEADLNALAATRKQLDDLRAAWGQLRQDAVPPDVQARLDEIDAELVPKADAAQTAIDELERQVKDGVRALGESVKAGELHAVFVGGRVTWNNKALDGFAAAHPEIVAFRRQGEPTVTIRKAAG